MKEKYYSSVNINSKSREFLELLKSRVYPKKPDYNPMNSALLILDMQDYFLSENSHAFVPSSPAIIPQINLLIRHYKDLALPVIFTRHINTYKNSGLMDEWWRGMLSEEHSLSNINKDIDSKDSIFINKSQYDAFYETELENILNKKNVSQLLITGVMTHLCCESTVRSSFIRNIMPIFPIDTTATYNIHFHLSSFINLGHGFTPLIHSEEIVLKLESLKHGNY